MNRRIMLCACAIATIVLNCTDRESGSVPTLAETSDNTVYLRPVDSLGSSTQDGLMLNSVRNACITNNGRIAMLDGNSIRVFVDHDPVHELDLTGDGPGQFRTALWISDTPSGNLVVGSYYDRKVAFFDTSLVLTKELLFDIPGISGPDFGRALSDTSVACVHTVFELPDSAGTSLFVWSNDEQPDQTIRRRMAPFDQERTFGWKTLIKFDLISGERFCLVDRSMFEYRILCTDLSGDSLFEIEMDYTPVKKSDEEIQEQYETYLNRWIRAGLDPDDCHYQPPEYEWAIYSIQTDNSGRIWVRDGNDPFHFNVFDDSGNPLFECTAELPQWQDCDKWAIWIEGDRHLAAPLNPAEIPKLYILEEFRE